MAERQLRSRKRDISAESQAKGFSQSPVMFTDNPSEHVDKVAETTSSGVSVGQLEGSSSSNGVVERIGKLAQIIVSR
jgi:hypothetical protein